MKKLNKLTAALASLALVTAAFTGCVNSHPDDEVMIDLTQYYLVGATSTGWNFAEDNQFSDNGDGTYSLTYTATADTAFAIAESSWTTQFRTAAGSTTPIVVTVGDTDVEIDCQDPGFGNNGNLVGTTEGSEYKMTIKGNGADIILVSFEAVGGSSGPSVFADTSALNATTAVQVGAYIKLEGDSTGTLTGLKLEFNGTTTAKALFAFDDSVDFSAWGMDHWAAWFKFYAGDNVDLGYGATQLKATTTTLGATGNIAASGDGYNNFEVTDLTGAGVYEFVITATADGATYSITKIGSLN